MAEEGYKVALNVYDLSQGLARQLSTTFLGKAIEGIWHTGVVVYGNEYYFGGGIQHASAGSTPYGTPVRVFDLGVTHVPKEVFEMYLQEISPRFTAETYSLLTHNCNNFSNEVAQFLVGINIPDYVLNLPNEVMSSPMGALIMPMIQQLESTLRANGVPQAPQFQPAKVAATSQATDIANKTSGEEKSQSKLRQNERRPASVQSKTSEGNGGDDAADKSGGDGGQVKPNGVTSDPLGDARTKVQDEISKEFAAIMATGTFRASEAAALATRKVMQRYGHMNAARS